MIARIGPVTEVADTGSTSANVYRSPLIPSVNTNALQVQAATLDLLPAVGATVARGSYLNAATATEPVCVLGAQAAQLLGIDRVYPGRAGLARRDVVLRHRHPHLRHARARDRQLRARRLSRRREIPRPRRSPDDDLRPHRHQPDRRRPVGARRDRQPRIPERGRRQPALGRAHGPRRRRRARSTASSSAWAPSRCSSAQSASPTS